MAAGACRRTVPGRAGHLDGLAAHARQPVRELAVAPGARRPVGRRPARPLRAAPGARPGRRGGRRPGPRRPRAPGAGPPLRRDQHGLAEPDHAARRHPGGVAALRRARLVRAPRAALRRVRGRTSAAPSRSWSRPSVPGGPSTGSTWRSASRWCGSWPGPSRCSAPGPPAGRTLTPGRRCRRPGRWRPPAWSRSGRSRRTRCPGSARGPRRRSRWRPGRCGPRRSTAPATGSSSAP